MFDSIVPKITSTIRNAVRSIGAATRHNPWIMSLAILAFFSLVSL